MSNHILFVDPFASAEFLVSSLRAKGIQISVVYTVIPKSDYITTSPGLFNYSFKLNSLEELPSLITTLRPLAIDRVYYGAEVSVAIADQIAQQLCPEFSNPIKSANSRANKYEMQEALRKTGLPYIRQIKINNSISTEQEIELFSWNCSFIIKPANSAANTDVLYCESIEEIKTYLQVRPNHTIFGQAIQDFVVQEYLEGEEYFVDTFSINKEFFVSGVQRYHRKNYNKSPICLYSELVSPNEEIATTCINFVEKVLNAVELYNGFGHTEIMLTSKGPYLIEVNPRISGALGYNNKLFQVCGLPGQVDLLIASCQNAAMPKAKQISYGRKVLLHNYKQRIINNLNVTLLATLPSFVEAHMLKKAGSFLSYPKNLTDAVGIVLLANINKMQLLQDYEQILEWEKNFHLF